LNSSAAVHTLGGGFIPRKRRQARRPGLTREPALLFYPKFAAESVRKAWSYWRGFRRAKGLLRRIVADPARHDYEDLATRPLDDNELKALDLFHETRGGEAAVEKMARQEALLESVRATHAA